jgi:hypothetical protein
MTRRITPPATPHLIAPKYGTLEIAEQRARDEADGTVNIPLRSRGLSTWTGHRRGMTQWLRIEAQARSWRYFHDDRRPRELTRPEAVALLRAEWDYYRSGGTKA